MAGTKTSSLESLYNKYSDRTTFAEEVDEQFVTTGSVILDQVISDGRGLPRGKWVQITSDSGVGKTHITLFAALASCKRGFKVVYMDTEKGVNNSQMEGIGIKPFLGDKFFLYSIDTVEEAEEIFDSCLEDEEVSMVIIDSITDLVPEKMITNSASSAEPGIQARVMSNFLVKYRAKVARSPHKPTVFLVNQQRVHINFMGSSVGEAGGNAQKYRMDIRLMAKKEKDLMKTVDTISGKQSIKYGSEVSVWATKNRYAAPFVQAKMTILFGKGISNIAAYQTFLMERNMLVMKGAGFWTLSLPGKEEQKARGSEELMRLLKQNLSEIKQLVQDSGGFKMIKTDEKEEDGE